MPQACSRPGANGANNACSAPGARRTQAPCGSCRDTGHHRPHRADRPMAWGSAKQAKTSQRSSLRLSARAPMKRCGDTATSTKAHSASCCSGTFTSKRLLRRKPMLAGTRPLASRPPARPALVASRSSGKALLVPVDRVSSGTSAASAATALWVPSPPSTAIIATPRSTMRRVARRVSATVWVSGRSRISMAGQCWSRAPGPWLALSTAAAMPVMSLGNNTWPMPVAPKAASRRWIAEALSVLE